MSKQGTLAKKGKYTIRKRASIFTLEGNSLNYVNAHGKAKAIPLQDCTIGGDEDKSEFTVHVEGRTYELEAADVQSKNDWIEAIEKSKSKPGVIDVDIGKNENKKPAEELVKRLSKVNPTTTKDAIEKEHKDAAARKEALDKVKADNAKVDIDGAKAKSASDGAKADKAKASKDNIETKELTGQENYEIPGDKAKAERVIEVEVGKTGKAKPPKKLVKRLSKTKAPPSKEDIEKDQADAAARKNATDKARTDKAKVDLDGVKAKAETDEAKADKAKACKDKVETNELTGKKAYVVQEKDKELCKRQIIVVTGPPASGKGTFSKKIKKYYGIVHLSTGDMLRALTESNSEAGRQAKAIMENGELVSDELVVGLIKEAISKLETSKGFILDGFPRTLEQGELLETILKQQKEHISDVIYISVPDKHLVKRVTGRRIHKASGRSYHIVSKPPKVEGKDDETGEDLICRPDDNEKALVVRLENYHALTQPLLKFYESHSDTKVHKIDGTPEIDEVEKQIFATLDSNHPTGVIVVDIGKNQKAKPAKGLVKRLSKTKIVPTSDDIKKEQNNATVRKEAADKAKVEKAKVDIDGAKSRAATDEAKADKAKAASDSVETKELTGQTKYVIPEAEAKKQEGLGKKVNRLSLSGEDLRKSIEQANAKGQDTTDQQKELDRVNKEMVQAAQEKEENMQGIEAERVASLSPQGTATFKEEATNDKSAVNNEAKDENTGTTTSTKEAANEATDENTVDEDKKKGKCVCF